MKQILLLLIVFISVLHSQIKINGDAMVRPRYDMIDNGKYADSRNDFYYMYRARINLRADIGDGWHFKTQLGHHGYGAFGMTNQNTTKRLPNEIEGSSRPSVDFLQMYFGYESNDAGIIGGIIPLNSLNNPLFDLHYYPNIMIDIPNILMGVDGVFGFTGYIKILDNKLTAYVLKDKNEIYVEDPNGIKKNDKNDSYTLGASYNLNFGNLSIEPNAYLAVASEGNQAPTTLGLNLKLKEVGPFTLFATGGISNQKNTGTIEYDANFLRIKLEGKLGSGLFTFWYDLANRNDKLNNLTEKHKFNFYYLMYTFTVYKSDKGTVTIAPTIMNLKEKVDNKKDYDRYKFEISTNIY